MSPMDSWGSQDILAGFEPADPRSNRGESVYVNIASAQTDDLSNPHFKFKRTAV